MSTHTNGALRDLIGPKVSISMDTRWLDAKGREWRIIEKFPFGLNICTTVDRRFQGNWKTSEIRKSVASPKVSI